MQFRVVVGMLLLLLLSSMSWALFIALPRNTLPSIPIARDEGEWISFDATKHCQFKDIEQAFVRVYVNGVEIKVSNALADRLQVQLVSGYNGVHVVVFEEDGPKQEGVPVALCYGQLNIHTPEPDEERHIEDDGMSEDYMDLRNCKIRGGNLDAVSWYRRRGVYLSSTYLREMTRLTVQNQLLRRPNLPMNIDSLEISLSECPIKPPGANIEDFHRCSDISSKNHFNRLMELKSGRNGEDVTLTTSFYKHMHILGQWTVHMNSLGFHNTLVLATDAASEQHMKDFGVAGGCFSPCFSQVSVALSTWDSILHALKADRAVQYSGLEVFLVQHPYSLLSSSSYVSVFQGMKNRKARKDSKISNHEGATAVMSSMTKDKWISECLEMQGNLDILLSATLGGLPDAGLFLARPTEAAVSFLKHLIQISTKEPQLSLGDAVRKGIGSYEGLITWGLISQQVVAKTTSWGEYNVKDKAALVAIDCEEISELELRLGKLHRLYAASTGPVGFGNSLTPVGRNEINLGLPVFALSIARNAWRRKSLLSHLSTIGIQAQLYKAWDGYGLSIEENSFIYDEAEHLLNNVLSEGLNRGNIGTCLAHYRLWQQLLDMGIEQALIIEDDARFSPQDVHKLKDALTLLPKDWDMIHLTHREFDGTVNYHPYEILATSKEGAQLVSYPRVVYYLLGYIINKRAMETVLSRVYPIYEVVDVFVNPRYYSDNTRAGDTWKGLKRYGLTPGPTRTFVSRDAATGTTVYGDAA